MPNILSNRRAALLIATAIFTVGLPINHVVAGCTSGSADATDLLSSDNCQASAPGTDSLAVGAGAQAGTAGGASDTALGDSALAGTSGSFNTAVGAGANAGLTSNNTAIGANTIAVNGSIAIGGEQTDPADAIGEHSIAIGINSFARSRETVAVGLNTGDQSTGAFNTWMGSAAGQGVDGLANSAFGTGAGNLVSGNFNIAIGTPDTPSFTPGAGSNVTGNAKHCTRK
jgi:hypothetical protein